MSLRRRTEEVLGLFTTGGFGAAIPEVSAQTIAPVKAARLIVRDNPPDKRSKLTFTDADDSITKGAGTDVGDVSVAFHVAYEFGNVVGSFTLPMGAFDGHAGWIGNDAGRASYKNRLAPDGPTEARGAIIQPGKVVKLVAQGLGDEPFEVLAGGDPKPGRVFTAYCVTNGGEEFCYTTEFSACAYRVVGSVATLKCGSGQPDPTGVALGTTTTTSTSSTTTTTPACTFVLEWGSTGNGAGQFSFPQGVAVGGSTNVYVADSGNNRLQKFDATGAHLATFANFLNNPRGVTVNASEIVYATDSNTNKIKKFSATGTLPLTWGSTGSGNGQFNGAWEVAEDTSGNVYVGDASNSRIQKFTCP